MLGGLVVTISTVVLQYCYVSSLSLVSQILPENAKLNFVELATKYGHPPMEYKIVTEDNYILTLYRLPGKSPYPILLTHGILDSSDTYLIRGENSLGITLANEGHDVWLGNLRGNRYSRKHVYLDPDKDAKYWDYGYHEVGYYDLPAILDKVLNETKATNVTAIGHSLGNTIYYVLGSTRSEYNSKINVLIALAPICYLHHSVVGSFLAPKTYLFEVISESFGIYEAFGDNNFANRILKTICKIPVIGYALCTYGLIFPVSGYNKQELEPRFFPVAIEHFLTGTSVKLLLQYLQNAKTKAFARYDYGREKNLLIYNSSSPPTYDLKKVTMPVALYTGRNDHLSSIEDVALLREQLPNVVYDIIIPYQQMTHADFTWGRTMNVYLYPYIFKVLEKYIVFHKKTSIADHIKRYLAL